MKLSVPYVTVVIFCSAPLVWMLAPSSAMEDYQKALEFYEPGSDSCYGDERRPLDIVFLVDRTSKTVIDKMPEVVKIADKVAEYYKGSRFGITFYSDFQCSDWWGEHCPKHVNPLTSNATHHMEPEGCYTFGSALSSDISALKEKVKPGAITQLHSAHYTAATAALMMTASDTNLGLPSSEDAQFRRRVIGFMVTESIPSFDSKEFGTKNPPKGDGHDKCATIDNPEEQFVKDKLKERNFFFIFLLLGQDANLVTSVKQYWSDTMSQDLRTNFTTAQLNDTVEAMFDKLRIGVNQNTYLEGHIPCADPPAYNTLGL